MITLLVIVGLFGVFMYVLGCKYTEMKIEKEVNEEYDEFIENYEIVRRK